MISVSEKEVTITQEPMSLDLKQKDVLFHLWYNSSDSFVALPFAISKAEVFGAIGLRGDQVAERQYDAVIEVPCLCRSCFCC